VRLLDAAWSEGRDITSDTVICEIADSIGLNGQELLGKAQTVEIKERLRLQTETAIQAGYSVSQPLQWTTRSFGEMTGFRF
jgi:2-hydroxychromene-2-carboxylate isomerase